MPDALPIADQRYRSIEETINTVLNYLLLTHTDIHTWILSGTTQVSQYQKGKTRKVKPIRIYWNRVVASAEANANLHLDPDI